MCLCYKERDIYIYTSVSVLGQSETRFPLNLDFFILGLKKIIPYNDELKYLNGFGLCMNERVISVISEMQKCSD